VASGALCFHGRVGRVTTRVPRTRVDVARAARVERPDTVVVEEPLEIRVGEEAVTATMRTPGDDFDLALGHLLTEGMIGSVHDIASMMHCTDIDADGSPTSLAVDLAREVGMTLVAFTRGPSFSVYSRPDRVPG
jgi:FdhD protein